MKIGYLGPKGTFSETAALIYNESVEKAEMVEFNTICDVLEAVNNGSIDEGVVPFENSIEGTVTCTLDALIFEVELYIKAEIIIPVFQRLMIKSENKNSDITKILSHPQGLAQCGKALRRLYPNSITEAVNSTAEAAKIVSESSEHWAAISPARAAEVYGLEIIDENIQDDDHNATRFVVVTKQNENKSYNEKTSFAFSTENKPGELYRILDIISIWDLNMTKIESRPMKNKLGTYVFFVDVETKSNSDLIDGLKMVERKTSYFKFLGSYPVFAHK